MDRLHLAAIAGVAIGATALWGYVQSVRLTACKAEFAAFRLQVKTLGEDAERRAHAADAANRLNQEKANADLAKARSANAALNRRLRDGHPAGSGVPEAPPASGRPDLACYSRPDFIGAYGSLVTGVRGLADEGTESAIDLNSAKSWAIKFK